MAIWRKDRGSRRFTTGMLAVLAASVLFSQCVGEQTVDPATRFMGANTSNILIQLLVVAGCHELVAGMDSRYWTPRRRRAWLVFATTAGTIALASYTVSDRLHQPADQLTLSDPASLVGYWTFGIMLVATFALMAAIAVENLAKPGVDLHYSMVLALATALAGVITGGIVIGCLATNPEWLHENYREVATHASHWGLSALAIGGAFRPVEIWLRRDDPRS